MRAPQNPSHTPHSRRHPPRPPACAHPEIRNSQPPHSPSPTGPQPPSPPLIIHPKLRNRRRRLKPINQYPHRIPPHPVEPMYFHPPLIRSINQQLPYTITPVLQPITTDIRLVFSDYNRIESLIPAQFHLIPRLLHRRIRLPGSPKLSSFPKSMIFISSLQLAFAGCRFARLCEMIGASVGGNGDTGPSGLPQPPDLRQRRQALSSISPSRLGATFKIKLS
jgi:hypothetical protein